MLELAIVSQVGWISCVKLQWAWVHNRLMYKADIHSSTFKILLFEVKTSSQAKHGQTAVIMKLEQSSCTSCVEKVWRVDDPTYLPRSFAYPRVLCINFLFPSRGNWRSHAIPSLFAGLLNLKFDFELELGNETRNLTRIGTDFLSK